MRGTELISAGAVAEVLEEACDSGLLEDLRASRPPPSAVTSAARDAWLGALVLAGLAEHDGATGQTSAAPLVAGAAALAPHGLSRGRDPASTARALFAAVPPGGYALAIDTALSGRLADAVAHPLAGLHFARAAARARAGGQSASFGAGEVRAALLAAGFAEVTVTPLPAAAHLAVFRAVRR